MPSLSPLPPVPRKISANCLLSPNTLGWPQLPLTQERPQLKSNYLWTAPLAHDTSISILEQHGPPRTHGRHQRKSTYPWTTPTTHITSFKSTQKQLILQRSSSLQELSQLVSSDLSRSINVTRTDYKLPLFNRGKTISPKRSTSINQIDTLEKKNSRFELQGILRRIEYVDCNDICGSFVKHCSIGEIETCNEFSTQGILGWTKSCNEKMKEARARKCKCFISAFCVLITINTWEILANVKVKELQFIVRHLVDFAIESRNYILLSELVRLYVFRCDFKLETLFMKTSEQINTVIVDTILQSAKCMILRKYPSLLQNSIQLSMCHDCEKGKHVTFVLLFKGNIEMIDTIQEKIMGKEMYLCNYTKPSDEAYNVLKLFETSHSKETLPTVSEKEARQLFKRHSNLMMISASHYKSIGNSNGKHRIVKKPCILFLCLHKGYIPYGEEEFPRKIRDVEVDVQEGVCNFANGESLEMGGHIRRKGSKPVGSIGGFVNLPGSKIGFITCAHVVLSFKELKTRKIDYLAEVETSINSAHSYKVCGKVINAEFPKPDDCNLNPLEGSSVDAALIELTSSSSGAGFLTVTEEQLRSAGFQPNKPPRFLGKIVPLLNLPNLVSDSVVKYGAGTGLTLGRLFNESMHVRIISQNLTLYDILGSSNLENVVMYNQIEIEGIRGQFFDFGDSGSFVFCINQDDTLSCIGMAIGFTSRGTCLVTPIENVLKSLKLPVTNDCIIPWEVRLSSSVKSSLETTTILNAISQIKSDFHKQQKDIEKRLIEQQRDIEDIKEKLPNSHPSQNQPEHPGKFEREFDDFSSGSSQSVPVLGYHPPKKIRRTENVEKLQIKETTKELRVDVDLPSTSTDITPDETTFFPVKKIDQTDLNRLQEENIKENKMDIVDLTSSSPKTPVPDELMFPSPPKVLATKREVKYLQDFKPSLIIHGKLTSLKRSTSTYQIDVLESETSRSELDSTLRRIEYVDCNDICGISAKHIPIGEIETCNEFSIQSIFGWANSCIKKIIEARTQKCKCYFSTFCVLFTIKTKEVLAHVKVNELHFIVKHLMDFAIESRNYILLSELVRLFAFYCDFQLDTLFMQTSKKINVVIVDTILQSAKSMILKKYPSFLQNAIQLSLCHDCEKGKSVTIVLSFKSTIEMTDITRERVLGRKIFLYNYTNPSDEAYNVFKSFTTSHSKETLPTVSEKKARQLFRRHSNLTMISASPYKSIGYSKGKHRIEEKPCILLLCLHKGYIPYGEEEFPRKIGDVEVDVQEGFCRFRNGDALEMGGDIRRKGSKSIGSIGGFVNLSDGKFGLITCAHVVLSHKELLERKISSSDEVEAFIKSDRSYKVCGNVTLAAFPKSNDSPPNADLLEESSVDAALIELISSVNVAGFRTVSVEQLSFAGLQEKSPKFDGSFITSQNLKEEASDRVVKYGATTGLTLGSLFKENSHVRISHEENGILNDILGVASPQNYTVYNQMEVEGLRGKFFAEGDSGSFVFNINQDNTLRCVGMAIGDTTRGTCLVTPIERILQALQPKVTSICGISDEPKQLSMVDIMSKIQSSLDSFKEDIDKRIEKHMKDSEIHMQEHIDKVLQEQYAKNERSMREGQQEMRKRFEEEKKSGIQESN